MTSIGPSRPLRYWVCSLTRENQYMPPVVAAPPANMSGRAPVRLISWETMPETTTIVPANGRKRVARVAQSRAVATGR